MIKIKEEFFNHLAPKFGDGETLAMWKYYNIHCLNHPTFKQDYLEHIRLLSEDYPIQYLVGEAAFYDSIFSINESVLIPRPETEELVDWIIEEHKHISGLSILDIGTGSGCIGITLAKHLIDASVIAIDIDEDALNVPRVNAKKLGVDVTFHALDILNGDVSHLPRVDIIVSNPPYISIDEKDSMSTSTLKHEPDIALYAVESDPNVFYRWIALNGRNLLREEGSIYVELNALAHAAIVDIFNAEQWKTTLKTDMFGNYRMLKGTR